METTAAAAPTEKTGMSFGRLVVGYGIVIAFLLGQSILGGALAFGILTSASIALLATNRRVKEDTAIGVLFAGMFALGVVLFARRLPEAESVRDQFHNFGAVSRGAQREVYVGNQRVYVGGDILLRIDETTITRLEQVETLLEDHYRVGDSVTVTLLRDGQEYSITVTLAEEPS